MRSFVIIIFIFVLSIPGHADTWNDDLQSARLLYHQAIEDKELVEPAIRVFEKIAQNDSSLSALCQVYQGSLTALKGKHSFSPYKKFKYVKDGLKIMDSAVNQKPDDVEIIFIRASTCFYLPSFFGRKEQSRRDFLKIVDLFRENPSLVALPYMPQVLEFILKHITLPEDDRSFLMMYTGVSK